MVYAGRRGAGRGRELLGLLGTDADVPDEFGQLERLREAAPRMRGHEIGDEELFFAEFFVRLSVRSDEFFRVRPGRFSHVREDLGARVFRGDLELSAYVVGAELLQKCVSARICQNVIVSDAGADENLLDPGNLPHSPEKEEIPPME